MYLLSTAGIAVSLHFCMGKLEAMEFYKSNGNCSCEKKKEVPAKCCTDQFKFFKVKDDHKNTGSSSLADNWHTILNTFHSSFSNAELSYHTVALSLSDNSPPRHSCPIYLDNCTFRI